MITPVQQRALASIMKSPRRSAGGNNYTAVSTGARGREQVVGEALANCNRPKKLAKNKRLAAPESGPKNRQSGVAVGETDEEVRALIREAIDLYLDRMRADGLVVPAPSSRVEYVEVASAA
ncbi:MAG: type II toxin-antitoxin system HicB family antitoxin [Gemmatimonadetes bacterium]|nr:type II toxin-antitoxin system HicB family antitoxin [Gemmatimonadota bacterium]